MNTRATLQVVMVGIALGGASMAANAIVSSWDFRAFGGFEGPGNDDGFPTPTEYVDVINTDGDYAHFGWGTPTGQEHSHLTINEVDPTTPAGDLTKYYRDNGPPGEIQPGISDLHGEQINQISTSDPTGEVVGWAVHHNFVIGEAFDSGIVRTNFHLQLIDPANPGVVVWDSGELDLTFEVWETPNFIGGPCPPDGDPTGPNGSECDDRFRVKLGYDGVTRPAGAVFDQRIATFPHLGDNYAVSLTGFWDEGLLSGEFWSAEGDFRHMELRAEVHVPEPTTLALMGLGLAGLGFTARRRKQRDERA